jgi:hypothetical protein
MVDQRQSDDELAAAVGALLQRADAVPELVRAAASASLAWRDPDAALATLVEETLESTTVRGRPPRLLTFQAPSGVIEIELTRHDDGARLTGQLIPMRPATVTVCRLDTQSRVDTDELGRFSIAGLDDGLVRLRCAVPGDPRGSLINTEWFTI